MYSDDKRRMSSEKTTAHCSCSDLDLCLHSTASSSKTKIQVASWWSFESGSSLDALKNAFEAQNPEIEVEFVQIPSSEYYTKVLTMVAGGTSRCGHAGMDKLGTWVPRVHPRSSPIHGEVQR